MAITIGIPPAIRDEIATVQRDVINPPFGPVLGTRAAQYQPMMLTLERFERSTRRLIAARTRSVSFMPGPVEISRDVQAAFAAQPQSHRSKRRRRYPPCSGEGAGGRYSPVIVRRHGRAR